MTRNRTSGRQNGNLVTGVILVLVGGVLLLARADYLEVGSIIRFWPLILIVMGLAKLADDDVEQRRSAAWLLIIGGIFLLNSLQVLHISESWPLFIVAAGVMTMWKAGRPARPAGSARAAESLDEGQRSRANASPPERTLGSGTEIKS
jgi:hypothetical protein